MSPTLSAEGPDLVAGLRQAMEDLAALGYDGPYTALLSPVDAVALDLMQTEGPEAFYQFGIGQFAWSPFGLSIRIGKNVTADGGRPGRLRADLRDGLDARHVRRERRQRRTARGPAGGQCGLRCGARSRADHHRRDLLTESAAARAGGSYAPALGRRFPEGDRMALLKRRKVLPSEPASSIITVSAPGGLFLSGKTLATYDSLYRTSAPVRAVVDFMALNIAQVPLAFFQRTSEGRERLGPDDPLDSLMRQPNGRTSGFEFRRDLMTDLLLAGNAYALKVRAPNDEILSLVRVRPSAVSIRRDTDTEATTYRVQFTGGSKDYAPEDVWHLRTYSEDGILGTSPLESLRSILAEDDAAVKNREFFWRNFARASGWILRPLEAPELSDVAMVRLKEDLRNAFSGEANSGQLGMLDEGMTFDDASISPKEAEYTEARKLTLQIVCSVYGIPLQLMSGDNRNLDAAQRGLLTNSLAPELALIEEAANRDLVIDVHGEDALNGRIFAEHILEEKSRGSFSQQAEILQRASGGSAWMTPNEIRALLNLPPVEGGDQLAI